MKRTFLLISLIFALFIIVSSCATREKCPAYGHYTEVAAPIADDNLAELKKIPSFWHDS